MSRLIDAFRVRDGKPVRIPDDWIGHPVLGHPFTLTDPSPAPAVTQGPRGRKRSEQPAAPVADEIKED